MGSTSVPHLSTGRGDARAQTHTEQPTRAQYSCYTHVQNHGPIASPTQPVTQTNYKGSWQTQHGTGATK